jgi:uncharacterized protein (TIGR02300 family)
MAKKDLGTKRTCQSCSSKFYDLNKAVILCPVCGEKFDPNHLPKPRRGRKAKEEKIASPAENTDILDDDNIEDIEDIEDDLDDTLIEDASDLGEDEDDLGEVMEHIEQPEKEE